MIFVGKLFFTRHPPIFNMLDFGSLPSITPKQLPTKQ